MFLNLPISYWIGFVLIFWLLIDLVRGEAYIWYPYMRDTQPGMYWLSMSVWTLVAASCFIYPHVT